MLTQSIEKVILILILDYKKDSEDEEYVTSIKYDIEEEIILESSSPSNNKSSTKKSVDNKLTPPKNLSESVDNCIGIVNTEKVDNKSPESSSGVSSTGKNIITMLQQPVSNQGEHECITIKDNQQITITDTITNKISPDSVKTSLKFKPFKNSEKVVLGTTRPMFYIENKPKIVLGDRSKMEIGNEKQRVIIDVDKQKTTINCEILDDDNTKKDKK